MYWAFSALLFALASIPGTETRATSLKQLEDRPDQKWVAETRFQPQAWSKYYTTLYRWTDLSLLDCQRRCKNNAECSFIGIVQMKTMLPYDAVCYLLSASSTTSSLPDCESEEKCSLFRKDQFVKMTYSYRFRKCIQNGPESRYEIFKAWIRNNKECSKACANTVTCSSFVFKDNTCSLFKNIEWLLHSNLKLEPANVGESCVIGYSMDVDAPLIKQPTSSNDKSEAVVAHGTGPGAATGGPTQGPVLDPNAATIPDVSPSTGGSTQAPVAGTNPNAATGPVVSPSTGGSTQAPVAAGTTQPNQVVGVPIAGQDVTNIGTSQPNQAKTPTGDQGSNTIPNPITVPIINPVPAPGTVPSASTGGLTPDTAPVTTSDPVIAPAVPPPRQPTTQEAFDMLYRGMGINPPSQDAVSGAGKETVQVPASGPVTAKATGPVTDSTTGPADIQTLHKAMGANGLPSSNNAHAVDLTRP